MKAIEILKWICYVGQDSEFFNVIEIDEDFDFETFFGYPHESVEPGNYFYYYSDSVEESEMKVPHSKTYLPSFSIKTDFLNDYGEETFIHFYKIDE